VKISSLIKIWIKKFSKKTLIIAFWLITWEAVSFFIGNHILLVGPLAVFLRLAEMTQTSNFWESIWISLSRIFIGFSLAFIIGIILASVCASAKLVKEFMRPILNVIKSIPVASFVVLAIFWVGSNNLSMFISFITVLPIVYFNCYKAIKETDEKLLEMAKVFRVPLYKKVRYIYFRETLPHLISAANTGFGFAWKSGIAAELIGITQGTIGFNLHTARVFLQTDYVFAWTFAIVIFSYIVEKAFLLLLRRF